MMNPFEWKSVGNYQEETWLTSADVPIILTDQYHTCAVDCLAALAKTIVSKHSIELPPVW